MPSLSFFELGGFLTGLLFGSFLNVCIARIPLGQSIITPGSHCPTCNHPIRWFDNIPILSWLLLRARCRDCKAKIPWRYPAVELATGLWFSIMAAKLYFCWIVPAFLDVHRPTDAALIMSISVLSLAIFGFLLIGLIVVDWRTQRLPDAFTLTGIAAALFLICTQAIFLGPTDDQIVLNTHRQLRLSSPGSFAAHGNVFLTGPEALIFGRILAILGAALILLVVRWTYQAIRHREGLGLGDVKLLAMIAAFLGFWPAVLALFVGVLLATLYAVALLLVRRAHALTRLPLGSFLGIGGLFAALFGPPLIAWYTTLLH